MNNTKISRLAIIIIILFFLVFTQNAHAYLDPGTGSLVFQMAIAFFLGLSFLVKVYWRKLKSLFNSLFSKKARNGKKNE